MFARELKRDLDDATTNRLRTFQASDRRVHDQQLDASVLGIKRKARLFLDSSPAATKRPRIDDAALHKAVTNRLNMMHGKAEEARTLRDVGKQMPLAPNSNNSVTYELALGNFPRPSWHHSGPRGGTVRVVLCGRTDGLSRDRQTVLEIKTRQHYLPPRLSTTDWLQLQAYLQMTGARMGRLEERAPAGQKRVTTMERDDVDWKANVLPALYHFVRRVLAVGGGSEWHKDLRLVFPTTTEDQLRVVLCPRCCMCNQRHGSSPSNHVCVECQAWMDQSLS